MLEDDSRRSPYPWAFYRRLFWQMPPFLSLDGPAPLIFGRSLRLPGSNHSFIPGNAGGAARSRTALLALAAALVLNAAACTGPTAPSQVQTRVRPEQIEIVEAQENRARAVEVDVAARVYRLLADDTEGIPHQRFLLMLDNGTTVLVAHNTALAPRVPVKPGDLVRVRGEYVWNPKGGALHWTHRSDNPRHRGGFIEHMGRRWE